MSKVRAELGVVMLVSTLTVKFLPKVDGEDRKGIFRVTWMTVCLLWLLLNLPLLIPKECIPKQYQQVVQNQQYSPYWIGGIIGIYLLLAYIRIDSVPLFGNNKRLIVN